MPLRMSTRGRYGLRLMVALALNYGSGISLLKEVSRREGISEKYLGQIIMPLKNAGLVVSQRGSRGGYALARAPESVTVKDVVEAMEGSITAPPVAEEPRPSATAGAADRVWKQLAQAIERSLSSFTLAGLAREARRQAGPAGSYDI